MTNAATNKAMTKRNKRLCKPKGSGESPLGLSLNQMAHVMSVVSHVSTSANYRKKNQASQFRPQGLNILRNTNNFWLLTFSHSTGFSEHDSEYLGSIKITGFIG